VNVQRMDNAHAANACDGDFQGVWHILNAKFTALPRTQMTARARGDSLALCRGKLKQNSEPSPNAEVTQIEPP
jgi:hypothetical protein